MISAITAWDFSILLWIQSHLRCEALDWLMQQVVFLSDRKLIWVALSAVLLLVPRTRVVGFSMLTCLVLTDWLNDDILKPLFARPRPYSLQPISDMLIPALNSYSFPSGHSASSFAAATALFLFHRKAGAAAYAFALLVAFSRLYCYVHFPTDVLAGAAVGIAVAAAAAGAIRSIDRQTALPPNKT